MQNQPLIVFDFDGTIVDTLPFLIGIYNRLAPDFGCKPLAPQEADTLRHLRPQDFMRDFGVKWWKLPRMVLRAQKMLGEMREEIQAQPGMIEALQRLHKTGYELAIFTTNSPENTKTILALLGIAPLFSAIHTSNRLFGKHRFLRKLSRSIGGNLLYIGDETRDIEAAKRANVSVIAVTWGFQKRDILESLKPDALADTPEALIEAVEQIIKSLQIR